MTEATADPPNLESSSSIDIKGGNSTRKVQQCSKCNRLARKKCSQQACAQCCNDTQCEAHQQFRLRESIINGTHPVQIRAKKQRSLAVQSNTFREKGFKYMGETVLIWSFDTYMDNPKWKEEAIRKMKKNFIIINNSRTRVNQLKRKQFGTSVPDGEGQKKRFSRVMQYLYEKSIE